MTNLQLPQRVYYLSFACPKESYKEKGTENDIQPVFGYRYTEQLCYCRFNQSNSYSYLVFILSCVLKNQFGYSCKKIAKTNKVPE